MMDLKLEAIDGQIRYWQGKEFTARNPLERQLACARIDVLQMVRVLHGLEPLGAEPQACPLCGREAEQLVGVYRETNPTGEVSRACCAWCLTLGPMESLLGAGSLG